MKIKWYVLLLFLTVTPVCLFAQWTDNPLENTAIAVKNGELVQPRMVVSGDGSIYISWFDNAEGGFDVFLQRLNAGGYPQWQDGGIKLADRGFSSTQVYAVWADNRNGTLDIFAQNINADGSLGELEESGSDITFQVDMEIMAARELFDYDAGDRVYVVGDFNEWEADEMWKLEAEWSELFVGTFLFDAQAGQEYEYKYLVVAGPGREFPNDGLEGDVGPGENNGRVFTFSGEDQTLELVFFNNEDRAAGSFSLLEPADQSHFELNPDTDEAYTFMWEESVYASSYILVGNVFPDNDETEGAKHVYLFDIVIDAGDQTSLSISGLELAEMIEEITTNVSSGSVIWTVDAYVGAGLSSFADESREFTFTILESVNTEPESELPKTVRLHQNYPNPFNPSTNIQFELPEMTYVSVFVYDSIGRLVNVLINELMSAGMHQITWNAGSFSSGIYFVVMETEQITITRKMLLVK